MEEIEMDASWCYTCDARHSGGIGRNPVVA